MRQKFNIFYLDTNELGVVGEEDPWEKDETNGGIKHGPQ